MEYTEEEIEDIIVFYMNKVPSTNRSDWSFYVRTHCMDICNKAYHCPLEDVPLYISNYFIIVEWRLAHGK